MGSCYAALVGFTWVFTDSENASEEFEDTLPVKAGGWFRSSAV